MADHRNWAIATAAIWWTAAFWEGWRAWRPVRAHPAFAVMLAIAVIPLVVTGWKGAELVYRNGIGVLPIASQRAAGTRI